MWPTRPARPGGWHRPDLGPCCLPLVAALALIRFKQGVVRVIVACALAGWAWQALHAALKGVDA